MARRKVTTDRTVAERLSERVFSLSDDIRSVAVYYHGKLGSISRPHFPGSRWWDADQYEEIIINPTLMTLLRQRGTLDGGGIRHMLIQYGDFAQVVQPIEGGHLSVGFELNSNYPRLLSQITELLTDRHSIRPQRAGRTKGRRP